MGLSENVDALAARVASEIKAMKASPGGGPYSSLFSAADQPISGALAGMFIDVTNLDFTMDANTSYEVFGTIYWTVAATTTGFRWGLAGPVGQATVAAEYITSATAEARWMQQNNGVSIAPTMTATTTSGFAAPMINQLNFRGQIMAGALGGSLRVQMASELASVPVTVKRGSSLQYRVI